MGGAIGQLLPTAVGIAISPLPIVAVVLMLVTPRGKVNAPSFLVGWWIGLAVIGVLVLGFIGSTTNSSGDPSSKTSTIKLVTGVLLVLMASRHWRGRPHGADDPPTPKWMGALDSFTPPKAAGAGILLSAVNPKNLLLAVAGATALAQAKLSTSDETVVWIVFMIIASIGVAAPVVIAIAMGDRSREVLDRLKAWLAHNNAVIMAVLLLVIGVKLIGDAISGFSA